MKLPEVLNTVVTFDLPDWVTDEKYEYEKKFYFNKYHAWAGSYDRTESDFNVVKDLLFDELGGISATNFWPNSASVEVEFDCGYIALPCEIEEKQRELAKLLDKAKKLKGETIYINKPERMP